MAQQNGPDPPSLICEIFFNAVLDDSEAIPKKSNSDMEWPRPPPPLDGKFHHVFTFFNLKPSLSTVNLSIPNTLI